MQLTDSKAYTLSAHAAHHIGGGGGGGGGGGDSLPSQWIKRPWTEEQDEALRRAVASHGTKNWSAVSQDVEAKNGKQCRERWINHIDPAINRAPWTHEDDMRLIEAHSRLGNKWTELAALFDGRTDNAVKNRWNSTIQRKLRDQVRGRASQLRCVWN